MDPVEIPGPRPVEIPGLSPVEINAGAWYLRALRADDRLSDVPALTDLGVPAPGAYIAATEQGWANGDRCVWAVCIPTTGELVALIGVSGGDGTSRMSGAARAGYDQALDAARGPVARFAAQALGFADPGFHPGLP